MPSWIVPLLTAAGSSLAGLAIGWLAARYRTAASRERALSNGVQVLLKAKLSQIHEQYIEMSPQPSCPQSVADTADDVYQAYSALGGNGRGTVMWDEIMHAHAKK
ncbi:MAG: hypothetical protein LKI60_04395 [Bifidobacterium tibiigranuli]|jgi:hypothetical protein|nr:hypothetical protein [Bifidobacterium tibiigranuli]MCI1797469.1 hypothetical protein [Bifidobacterium tibiigranuli]